MNPSAYQAKQFVARLRSPTTGARFNVFESGDASCYLFDLLDAYDCSTCMQFPVRKCELRREYRSALRHGWGNSL
jgi:hypothetical protein